MIALTTLLSKIKLAIFAGLVVIAFSMTYLSKTLYDKVAMLESHNTELIQESGKKDVLISKLETSCQVTEKIATEVAIESEKLTTNIQEIVEAIDGMAQRDLHREERRDVQSSTVSVPADRNAELGRLLDDAYCSATHNDTYCTTR